MFETERNQPIRVWASALPVSQRRLGISNGSVDKAHAELEKCFVVGPLLERRQDRRGDAAVPPGDHLAVGADAGIDPLDRDGVVEIVLEVVLAGPVDLDRGPDRLRYQRRFKHIVPFRLAAEAAAQERGVDRDVLDRDAEQLGETIAAAAGALRRRIQAMHLPSATDTVAEGGSIVACAKCGR